MKNILIISLLILNSFLIYGQQIHLIIQAPPEFQEIEILTYENPFDDNVILLANLEKTKAGNFEYTITSPSQIRIAIKVGESSRDIILNSGFEYRVTLDLIKIKSDFLNEFLKVTSIDSNDPITTELFKIEREVEGLAQRNIRSNGKHSAAYPVELFNYWSKLLLEQKNKYEIEITNSKVFARNVSSIKKLGTDEQFKALNNLFVKNFSFSPAGYQALDLLYVRELWLEYALKYITKIKYLQFVDQEINKISDAKIRSSVELALVANALGRKYADQKIVSDRIQSIVETTPFTELKEVALDIQSLHSSPLIGNKIEDFKTLGLIGDTIRFSDFRGKFLLIDFWATWCGPCVKSMRKLPDLKKEMNGKLEVLCITFEVDKEKVERFIEKNNYREVLTFGFAINKKIMDSYFDIRAIPLYYLVSPEGVIIDKSVGEPFEMVKRHVK